MFRRSFFIAFHDVAMAAISFLVALYLRLGDDILTIGTRSLIEGTALFTCICAAVFITLQLPKRIWRYASVPDLVAITRAITLSLLIFVALLFLRTRLEGFPRSTLLINWMVLFILLVAPRFIYRVIHTKQLRLSQPQISTTQCIPVLLVGIGQSTELFLRALSHQHHPNYKVVGILDDHPANQGRRIYNVKVFGSTTQAAKIITKLQKRGTPPQKIVLSTDEMDGTFIRQLLDTADHYGLTLARLPKVTDLQTATSTSLSLHPIVIEDLLGRPQQMLDRQAMRNLIEGKRVLITGCGGTIGSELTYQIASYAPASLILIEFSEFNLYSIDHELSEKFPHIQRHTILADIRQQPLIDALFKTHRPEIVFHAAALKHVPMMEEHATEAVLTNIIGTKHVADCCITYGTDIMVLISTDKAVNPTNVMGATKRAAESYIELLGQHSPPPHTRFITVRFGNVLGSSGSVIPLFQKQLAKGGPLTVTHPDMTRYFMTVREAVELVLQASVIGSSTPVHSAIFVLDMGEPVRINDLAKQMIKMAGLQLDIDIQIAYTGLRPGEKLYEELFHDKEAPTPTSHASILRAAPRAIPTDTFMDHLIQIYRASTTYNKKETLALLHQLVPEYQPFQERNPS